MHRCGVPLLSVCALLVVLTAGCRSSDDAASSGGKSANKSNLNVTITASPTAPSAVATNNPVNATSAGLVKVPETIASAEVESLDGESFRLADYRGKVVVVDLWATWCGPCRNSIPHLVELQREFGDRGVAVIGLTSDARDDEADVRRFADDFKINYKLGWGDRTTTIGPGLARMTGRGVIPQAFVLTRDGRIFQTFVGFDPRQTPELMRKAIEQALTVKT